MMRKSFGNKSREKDIKTARVLGMITSPNTRACRVYNNADFTHNSTGNYLAITFNTDRSDTYGMHSTVSNTSRINIQLAGWYLITGHVNFEANATGVRTLAVRLDGSTIIASHRELNPTSGSGAHLSVATLYYFSAGSYIELVAYQNSGGDLGILYSSAYSPEFAAMRLG